MPEYQLEITLVGKDAASRVFDGVAKSLEKIGQVTGGILLSRMLINLSAQLTAIATSAISAAAEFQMMQAGLEGLVARELSALTGYAETIADVFPKARVQAAQLMDELARIAILSPYTVEATQQVFKMSMAFGFTTEQAKRMTAGLLNMAAGIGATQEMLQRMAYNLSQINLQGQVTKLDIRQLALAGLDLVSVLRFVGKEMGLVINDHKDFNAYIKQGKISWEQFSILFEKYADQNFGGAAERLSRTLVGLRSTWHDIWVLTMPKMLLSSVDAISGTLGKLLDILIIVRDSGHLEEIGAKWGEAITTWLKPLNKALDTTIRWMKNMQELGDVTYENVYQIQTLLQQGGNAFEVFARALEKNLSPDKAALLRAFVTGLTLVGKAIQFVGKLAKDFWDYQVGRILIGLGDLWASVKKFWAGWGPVIKKSMQGVGKLLMSIWNVVTDTIGMNLMGAFQAIGKLLTDNSDALGNFFANMGTWAEKAADWLYKVSEGFDTFIYDILTSDALATMVKGVVGGFNAMWNVVSQIFNGMVYVAKSIAQVWDEYGADIWNSLTRVAEAFGYVREESSKEAGQGMYDTLVKFGDYIVEKGPNIALFFRQVADAAERMVPAFDAARVTIGELITAFETGGLQGVMDYLINDVGPKLEVSLAGAFQSVSDSLDKLTDGKFGEVLDQVTGIVEGIGKVIDWLDKFDVDLKSAGTSLVGVVSGLAALGASVVAIAFAVAKVIGIIGAIATFGIKFSALTTIFGAIAEAAPVAGQVISGVISFLTPFAGVIALIAGAVVGTVAALVTNFAGFRDFVVENFQTIMPVLQEFGTFLESVLTVVSTAFGMVWKALIMPILQVLGAYLKGVVFPILSTVFDLIAMIGIPILQGLTAVFQNVLMPALGVLYAILQPIWQGMADIFTIALGIGKIFIWIVTNAIEVLVYALTQVWSWLAEKLQPVFEAVSSYVRDNFGPQLKTFAGFWDTLKSAIDTVLGLVKKFWEWLGKVADAFDNMELPSWLQQHSPSELEVALTNAVGLTKQLSTIELPRLRRQLLSTQEARLDVSAIKNRGTNPGINKSRQVNVTVNTGPVNDQVDMYNLAYTVSSVVQSAV